MTRVFFIHPCLSKNRKQFQVVLLFFVTLSIFNIFNERGSSFFNLPTSTPQGLTLKAAAKLKQLQQSTKQKIKKFWVVIISVSNLQMNVANQW
jgi:hypothetical protein